MSLRQSKQHRRCFVSICDIIVLFTLQLRTLFNGKRIKSFLWQAKSILCRNPLLGNNIKLAKWQLSQSSYQEFVQTPSSKTSRRNVRSLAIPCCSVYSDTASSLRRKFSSLLLTKILFQYVDAFRVVVVETLVLDVVECVAPVTVLLVVVTVELTLYVRRCRSVVLNLKHVREKGIVCFLFVREVCRIYKTIIDNANFIADFCSYSLTFKIDISGIK